MDVGQTPMQVGERIDQPLIGAVVDVDEPEVIILPVVAPPPRG
jgi:hypothetical protein